MKHIKKLLALALLVVSTLVTIVPALAVNGLPVGSTAYTIKGDVAVRRSPEFGDNIISRVNTGTPVTILQSSGQNNGFYRVSVPNVASSAYILADCLGSTAPGSGTPVGSYMYCNTSGNSWVNIRKYASTESLSIGRLYRGDRVYVVSTDGRWSKISSPINGYVMSSYLQTSDPGGGGNYSHPQSWEDAFGASGIIKRGNIGYKVANIQIVLGINQDAIFGKETENAIIAFQKTHKLKVDGLVGEQTKKELWKEGKSILTISGYTP